jgi:hypothetical protein
VETNEKIEVIRKAILRGGFPLQMEVSGILTSRHYYVRNSTYFFDPDERKLREFDIEAHMPSGMEKRAKNEWYFNPILLVECKKSQKFSWVFFDSSTRSLLCQIGHSIDHFTAKKGYDKSIYGELSHALFPAHYLFKYSTGSYQQIREDGSIEGKNEILDAISKIIKNMNYTLDRLNEFFLSKDRRDILFFFPIIVFSGDLYFASFQNKLRIIPAQHLIYQTMYYSKLTGESVPMHIDIVTKTGLVELLTIIEKEVRNIDLYMSKPETQKAVNALK